EQARRQHRDNQNKPSTFHERPPLPIPSKRAQCPRTLPGRRALSDSGDATGRQTPCSTAEAGELSTEPPRGQSFRGLNQGLGNVGKRAGFKILVVPNPGDRIRPPVGAPRRLSARCLPSRGFAG